MKQTTTERKREMNSISEMWIVYWEHEYYTNDDQASFSTASEAEEFAAQLREKGKRRVQVFSPDDDETEDEGF